MATRSRQGLLTGRYVALRPVQLGDADFLIALCGHEDIGFRGPLSGLAPAPAESVALITQRSRVQFIIETVRSHQRIGLFQTYELNARVGTAAMRLVLDPKVWRQGWPLEALRLATDYAFRVLGLRKVYVHVPEYSVRLDRLPRIARVEGRLEGYSYFDGQLWDSMIVAIQRRDWERSDRATSWQMIQVEAWPKVCETRTAPSPSDDSANIQRSAHTSLVNADKLVGRRVLLRVPDAADHEALYRIASSGALLSMWQHHGVTVTQEMFIQSLWNSALAVFSVVEQSTNRVIGLFSAYDPDFRSGIAHLSAMFDSSVHRQGWPFEASVLFLGYMFDSFRLRKIYGYTTTPVIQSVASRLGRLFREEARLSEHEWLDGRFLDLHIISVSQRDWDASPSRRILQRLGDRSHAYTGMTATSTDDSGSARAGDAS